jgi:hypothetical protein
VRKPSGVTPGGNSTTTNLYISVDELQSRLLLTSHWVVWDHRSQLSLHLTHFLQIGEDFRWGMTPGVQSQSYGAEVASADALEKRRADFLGCFFLNCRTIW